MEAARRTQDEADCIRLCVDWANGIDARRYDEVLDLFTEDGVIDRMGVIFDGRTAIKEFLFARPQSGTTAHISANARVTFEGHDVAKGFSYVLFFQGSGGDAGSPVVVAGLPSIIEYHDQYRRTHGGWRIERRSVRMALKSP